MSDFDETREEERKINELIDRFRIEHGSFGKKSEDYVELLEENKSKIETSINRFYHDAISSYNNSISLITNVDTRLYAFTFVFLIYYTFTRFLLREYPNIEYYAIIISTISSLITEKYILRKYVECLRNAIKQSINKIKYDKFDVETKLNSEDDKNTIRRFSDSLVNMIEISSNFIPTLNSLKNLIEHQIMCSRYFDSIYSFMTKYNLIKREKIKELSKLKSVNPNHSDENNIIVFYINKISNITSIPSIILVILYYDYIENIERVKYYDNMVKSNEKYLYALACFLIENDMVNAYEFNPKEISLVIKNMDYFSLVKLNNLLIDYNKIVKYIKDVILYGDENGVLKNDGFKMEQLLNQNNFNENFMENNIYNIIYEYVYKNIIEFNDYEKDTITKCLMGVSSLYSIRSLLEESCINIGNDEKASLLIFIYIRLEEEGNFGTTLVDAINMKEDYVRNQLKTFDNIYDDFKNDLRNGIWIKSTTAIMKRKIIDIEKYIIEIKETEEMFESAKTVFSSFVSDKTLIQILETNDIIAYTISWKPAWSGGGLKNFIESLSYRDGYWLAPYVPYSRIGVVPPNMTYSEFVDKFKRKLNEYEENTIANIIIQRFPTSELYINHIPIGEDYKSPLRIIQDIVYTHMRFRKISTFIRYGNIVDKTFFNRPFVEIMKDTIEIFNKDRQSTIMNELSAYDVKNDICDEFNVNNLVELKNFVNNHLKDDVDTVRRIENILKNTYLELMDDEIKKLSIKFYDKIIAYIKSQPILSS